MAEKHIQITTRSVKETRHLGKSLGAGIHQAIIIALTGELGSGKTAFVQGLARGLDVSDKYYITSPTFTLINEYPGRLRLFHVDLYRIEHISELEDLGLDEVLQQDAVIAIEWADKFSGDMFSNHLAFQFKLTGDESRQIDIFAYGHQAHDLLKALPKSIQKE